MLLRESGKKDSLEFDLDVVVGGESELGLEFETEILELTDVICQGDEAKVKEVRGQCERLLGPQKTVDVITVVSGFNGITKIANGTGLHLDPDTEKLTVEMRNETGIEDYSEAAKAAKFDERS